MSYLTFTDLDWGEIKVGDPAKTKNISYTNTGAGTVSNLSITVDCSDPNAVINGTTSVTFDVFSDWISPDSALIQNSYYPQFNGDESGQIPARGGAEILDKYKDTVLYCISLSIGSPYEKTVITTVTANYTYTIIVPADPIAVPPTTGSETITQETSSGIYTIIEKKDLGSTEPALKAIIAQADINQEKYENNGKIPL